jgi:hypothetical protein
MYLIPLRNADVETYHEADKLKPSPIIGPIYALPEGNQRGP